jgi:hypothetical protein
LLDSQAHRDQPRDINRQAPASPAVTSASGTLGASDSTFDDTSSCESSDDDDDQQEPPQSTNVSILEGQTLVAIHSCIETVAIPAWMARPPVNLGQAAHGGLSADTLFILFTVFLPMVLIELWTTSGSSEDAARFDNFYHLVAATNIVCAFATSESEADIYTQHYIAYRESLRKLFPHFKERPNHHFAMHNGAELKFWGPLMVLSEFPGERDVGLLQRIKTNNRFCSLQSYRWIGI